MGTIVKPPTFVKRKTARLFPPALAFHPAILLATATKNFRRQQPVTTENFLHLRPPVFVITQGQSTIGGQLTGHRNEQHGGAGCLEDLFSLHDPMNGMKNSHVIVFPNHCHLPCLLENCHHATVQDAVQSSSPRFIDNGRANPVKSAVLSCAEAVPADRPRKDYLPVPLSTLLCQLLLFAFVVNLPLGYLREASPRYSWRWFLYIHLSIPLLIILRLALDFGWRVIPFTILSAVGGQWLGGRIKRWAQR
jgi:hypothetical protein